MRIATNFPAVRTMQGLTSEFSFTAQEPMSYGDFFSAILEELKQAEDLGRLPSSSKQEHN